MRKVILSSALVVAISSVSGAADFVWQPACDNEWNSCCGEIFNWQNNWGQSSAGAFCPVEPTLSDDVSIGSDVLLSDTGELAQAGTLTQSGGTLTIASVAGLHVAQTAQLLDVDWQLGRLYGGSDGIYFNDNASLNGAGTKVFGRTTSPTRIVNLGTMTWNDGPIQLETSSMGIPQRVVLRNALGGTIDIACDQTLTEVNGSVLSNEGTIQKIAGTGTTVLNTFFNNVGIIHAAVGVIELRSGNSTSITNQSSGTLSAAPGAALDIRTRRLELPGGAILSGNVRVGDNGSADPSIVFLAPDVTQPRLTVLPGGRVSANIYRVGERLDMGGASFAADIRVLAGGHLDVTSVVQPFTSPLRISGTARLASGASIGGFQQSVFVLGPGRLDMEDGSSIAGAGLVSHGVTVIGVLRKAETSGTATISNQSGGVFSVASAGRVEILGGSLNVSGPMALSGTVSVAHGATLDAAAATLTANNGSAITGSGTVNVAGSLSLPSSTISPGDATGTLSVVGTPADVTLGAGSVLNIELGGTEAGEFDALSIAGGLTLGGTLNLSLVNGFVPQVGQTFAIITAGSRLGAFATINGSDIGNGRTVEVSYSSTGVLLTVAGSVVAGDVDGDGSVDLTDLSLLLAAFGTCTGDAAFNANADFDASGCVDLVDLSQLLANFGV